MILGEQMEQVTDGVIIAIVENITSLSDDTVNISVLLDIDEGVDIAKLGADASGSCVLSELFHESFRVSKELNCILHTRAEERVELITTPFDTVLNLIWEVSESAHGNGLLRRILRITIGGGFVGNNHLRVGFSSESTRLKQWLGVPYALTINVEASLDIIDGVNNEIKRLPEFIIENIFGLWCNECLVSCHLKLGIHDLRLSASSLRLGKANIGLSEKELTVQV